MGTGRPLLSVPLGYSHRVLFADCRSGLCEARLFGTTRAALVRVCNASSCSVSDVYMAEEQDRTETRTDEDPGRLTSSLVLTPGRSRGVLALCGSFYTMRHNIYLSTSKTKTRGTVILSSCYIPAVLSNPLSSTSTESPACGACASFVSSCPTTPSHDVVRVRVRVVQKAERK